MFWGISLRSLCCKINTSLIQLYVTYPIIFWNVDSHLYCLSCTSGRSIVSDFLVVSHCLPSPPYSPSFCFKKIHSEHPSLHVPQHLQLSTAAVMPTAEFSALVAVCFRSRPCAHPTTHTPKPAFCWMLSTSLVGFLMLSLVYMNTITMTISTSCYTLTLTSAVPISRFCRVLFLHILFMMPYLIPLVICDYKAMCYSLFAIEITKV